MEQQKRILAVNDISCIGKCSLTVALPILSAAGAEARTRYETLAATERFSLLRLLPLTGRTHQLRVHLAAAWHPLAGDFLYGTEDLSLIGRPALHSAMLFLTHPVTGEALRLTSPLPPDLSRLMTL